MKKNFNVLIFSFFLCFFICGCETLKDLDLGLDDTENAEEEKPEFVITINQMVDYPRATKLEREVMTFTGRTVWININPFLQSRHIEEIELIPNAEKPEFFDLKLKLDRRGRIMWIALSEEARLKKFGIIIDGVFYRRFVPFRMKTDEDDWVKLVGPFDAVTAEKLKSHAKKNYKLMNND